MHPKENKNSPLINFFIVTATISKTDTQLVRVWDGIVYGVSSLTSTDYLRDYLIIYPCPIFC